MAIRHFLLLLAISCIPLDAQAARGFGSTFGTGSTDVISVPSLATTSSFSASAWFLFASADVANLNDRIYDIEVGGGSSAQGIMTFNPSTLLMQFNAPFSVTSGSWSVPTPSKGAWHNVCVSYNGASTSNTPAIYLDGVAQTVSLITAPSGGYNGAASTNPVGIGNNAVTLNRAWDGYLAEIAMWNNTLLTARECLSLSLGTSPLKIRQASLNVYFPLYGITSGDQDWGPAHNAVTITGAKFAPHAPVQPYPNQVYAQ